MIYTSYWGHSKHFPKNAVVVGICQYPPAGWEDKNIKLLAPSEELLRKHQSNEYDDFMTNVMYIKELKDKGLTGQAIKSALSIGAKGKDVILCCYEKPGQFCHRYALAEFLGDVTEL